MQVRDLAIKLMVKDGSALPPSTFIPVLHRWIQTQALDEVMIDVTDYGHVHHGPGVILVCHDAIYGMDEEAGRRGLLLRQRRDAPGPLEDKLCRLIDKVTLAAEKLEGEPELAGKLRFDAGSLEISAFDRLGTPHTPAVVEALAPRLRSVLEGFWGAGAALEQLGESRARLWFSAKAAAGKRWTVGELRARLGVARG